MVIDLTPILEARKRREDAELLKKYLAKLRECGLVDLRILNGVRNTILTKGGVKRYRKRMERVIKGERFDVIGFR